MLASGPLVNPSDVNRLDGLKILIVANDPPGHAVYRYRCENIATILRRQGCYVDVVYAGDARIRVFHDVVILHRICRTPVGNAFVRAARRCGAVLVYSTDDLIFDPEAFLEDREIAPRIAQFAPLHLAALAEADGALLATDYLAERVGALFPQKPAFVVRNFPSDELWKLSQQAAEAKPPMSKRVTLGYLSGSATHDGDLAVIAPALRTHLEQFVQSDLLLVGPVAIPPVLQAFADKGRIQKHPFVPWRELPMLLARIDLNLAPLDLSRPLNRGKSEIKFLEAAAAAVPTLMINGAGFAECLRDAPMELRKSLLATSEPGNWENHLAMLVANPDARIRLCNASRQFARTKKDEGEAALVNAVSLFSALPSVQAGRKPSAINWPFSPRYLAKHVVEAVRRRAKQ